MTNLTNNLLSQNHFQLLGLPLSFDIERQALDKAYRQLQQVSHPDKFINQPSEFQRRAVQQTALNTEAYQALKSPVQRASHLLSLLNHTFDLNSYTVSDIELLMQQMQYREQLSDIKDEKDIEQLDDFADKVSELTKQTQQRISQAFVPLLSEQADADFNVEQMKSLICELQFLNKLTVDLDEVEELLM